MNLIRLFECEIFFLLIWFCFFFKLTSPNNGYLDQDGGITIEMDWIYSHLLHQPEYSHLDDIVRRQKLQMLYVLV